MNIDQIPDCWRSGLSTQLESASFSELQSFVTKERLEHDVFPVPADVFQAFQLTPLEQVRVLILGQDPYHDDGQAHGLSFSVKHGVRIPPSLRNIYKELETDLAIEPATHGCLESWARQGVLLLNTVLTVQAHKANSHRKRGWEQFTDGVVECVNRQPKVVFVLWGKPAQKKRPFIDDRHLVIEAPHPSPLSAHRGFFGSRPFSKINDFLTANNSKPIEWQLPTE